jgi:hypothetical protein
MKKEEIFDIDNFKFSNQNWIKVLDEIWKFAPNRYGRGKTGYDDNHRLAKIFKITGYELMLIMSFLDEHKIVEYDSSGNINLTSKGFDVALQNQNAVSNRRINRVSLYFSGVIAIFATINLFLGIDNMYIGLGVVLIIMVGINVLVQKINKL